MNTTERSAFSEEEQIPCDFSSIMDCADGIAPRFTGTQPPHNMCAGEYVPGKTFFDQWLEQNPDAEFTFESIGRGVGKMMQDAGVDLGADIAELDQRWSTVGNKKMEEQKPLPDPVGDLIRHFAIFYEHVYLLEGFPKDAQPQLNELKLLGQRIHECLLNRDGTLNHENVTRCEAAEMHVTLDYQVDHPDTRKRGVFIQVARGKAILRQKV